MQTTTNGLPNNSPLQNNCCFMSRCHSQETFPSTKAIGYGDKHMTIATRLFPATETAIPTATTTTRRSSNKKKKKKKKKIEKNHTNQEFSYRTTTTTTARVPRPVQDRASHSHWWWARRWWGCYMPLMERKWNVWRASVICPSQGDYHSSVMFSVFHSRTSCWTKWFSRWHILSRDSFRLARFHETMQIISGYIPVGHLCLAPHQHRTPSLWWSMGAPYPRRSASATWWTHRWDDGSKFLWLWRVRRPTCSTFFLGPLGITLGSWWQIPLLCWENHQNKNYKNHNKNRHNTNNSIAIIRS